MKIQRIEAIPYAIPYHHPLKFASGEVPAPLGPELARVRDEQRLGVEARPAPPGTGRWADHSFRRALPVLAGRLDADDLLALEHLLTEDAPGAVLHR